MTDIAIEFDDAMLSIYKRADKELKYKPTAFFQMLNKHRGVETAKRLINAPQVSDGYTKLWELGRLELTVEAVVFDNKQFHELFTEAEINRCEKRLSDYGYFNKR